jgi:hypothetical protein
MSSLFFGFIGGIVAWIVTTVLGGPIRRVVQLRQEAALILAKYDDLPWIGNPEAKPPENDWLAERREAYDKIGSELIAFADANSFIARQFHHRALGRYRLYIRNSGNSLRALGATYPGTDSWDQIHRNAMSALRIARWPSDVSSRRVSSDAPTKITIALVTGRLCSSTTNATRTSRPRLPQQLLRSLGERHR